MLQEPFIFSTFVNNRDVFTRFFGTLYFYNIGVFLNEISTQKEGVKKE